MRVWVAAREFSDISYAEGFRKTFMAEMTTNQVKPRVLVADDEQVIANTLAIILNQAGFEARAVYSGEKAIDALDTFHPDMLISDVIMTGMTGIEAAIQTRAKLPKCKILLFSGQAATADLLERARTQGHEFEILAKPVHPTDLLAKLRG
jgi:CheY-like chemotaxis protein